jgi:hypothetical protein
MQKTGCTHIAFLLSRLFDGTQVGKHNTASKDQINTDIYFLSSVRDPWDWYLSLWTFGVLGKGNLMHRLTQRRYRYALKLTFNNPLKNYPVLFREATKDISCWCDVYDESTSVESFRKWLKLLHDPNNATWLSDGYGDFVASEFCGFMSYRYLNLCCSNSGDLKNPRVISDYTDLVDFEKKHCYIDFFIRQESLEDNFCEAVEKIRPLTQEEKNEIWSAKKINASSRPLAISDYYDQESIDLIYNRDRLLIEKFGYTPPQIKG